MSRKLLRLEKNWWEQKRAPSSGPLTVTNFTRPSRLPRKLITVSEAAERTGFARDTYYKAVRTGRLRRYGLERDIRLDEDEVLEFLLSQGESK